MSASLGFPTASTGAGGTEASAGLFSGFTSLFNRADGARGGGGSAFSGGRCRAVATGRQRHPFNQGGAWLSSLKSDLAAMYGLQVSSSNS